MLPTNVLLYGNPEPLPERLPLRAGPLSLIYERGELRAIRLGPHEIVRGIYSAVRDHNWDTVLPTLHNETIERTDFTFRITYTAVHQQGPVDFAWDARIEGAADGTITFRMDGRARSTFERNRIGFCVLHPAAAAGQPCRIEHSDGATETGALPTHISPHQPFMEMAAIEHEVAGALWARVEFQGDIFEMEDQRNWTDASYKTYCTPLAEPFPVTVHEGDTVQQQITLSLLGTAPPLPATDEPRVQIEVDATTTAPLPAIGLGGASHGQALQPGEVERLRALNLAHLRVDLHLNNSDYAQVLQQATQEATALAANLEVALFLGEAPEAQLQTLAERLPEIAPPVERWLIFHQEEKSTAARWVDLARQHLAQYDPAVPFGGGTNAYFTELNRERPQAEQMDLVSYSLNPQVHAFDNASLVETLSAQATTVESARQFVGDTPVVISPVTLRPRFNPNATGPEPDPAPGELPAQVDPRQLSLFGAGWTLGSIKYLAESGVHSVTYYETTGPRGVMEREAGSPQPELFPSLAGGVFPLYHVLADVGEFGGGQVVRTVSDDPLRVEALALSDGEAVRVLLANLTGDPQMVVVTGVADRMSVRMMDATNGEAAMREPEAFRNEPGVPCEVSDGELVLKLPAFATARVDWEMRG